MNLTTPVSSDHHRILQLADHPNKGARITLSDRAYERLAYGREFEQIPENSQRFEQRMPGVVWNQRVKTTDDVTRLQLAYRWLHLRYAKTAPTSQRLQLLDYADRDPTTGAYMVTLMGIATGFATGMDRDDTPVTGGYTAPTGHSIRRVCLISPTIVTRTMCRVIDSHMWVQVDDLRIDPTLSADFRGLHLGATWFLHAELRAYTNSLGHRKIGVGEWTPMGEFLNYGIVGADDVVRDYRAPRHLIRRLRLVRNNDGTPQWADAGQLTREIERFEKLWPDVTDQADYFKP